MTTLTLESKIRIQRENFVVTEEIEAIKTVSKNIGGITTFLGTGRELNKGENITKLNFEHYPKMAEKKLVPPPPLTGLLISILVNFHF